MPSVEVSRVTATKGMLSAEHQHSCLLVLFKPVHVGEVTATEETVSAEYHVGKIFVAAESLAKRECCLQTATLIVLGSSEL